MKIEEAIETLEEKRKYCKMFYELSTNPQEDYPSTAKFMDALELALTALRSMQEARETFHIDRNEWTAEWIYPENEWNLPRCSKCGCNSKDATYGHKNNFCPKCGRAMTEEAWAELERRVRMPEPPKEE